MAGLIVAVGGVVYRRTYTGSVEVLLIRKRGGYWTLPKGKVELDEAQPAAIVREVAEETGIIGVVEAELLTTTYGIRKDRRRRKAVTYYLLRAIAGTLLLDAAEGIEQARWCTLRQAERQIHRNRVRGMVRAASCLLEVPAAVAD